MRLAPTLRARLPVMSCVALFGALSAAALAHPHHHIEQQAQLTISEESVELVLRIVPSIGEGGAMFDSIDLDGDGAVSEREAAALGAEIVAATELRRGETVIPFGQPSVSVPARDLVARGHGVIQVRATVLFDVLEEDAEALDFDVTYHRFDTTWFVQPFVSRDLAATTSSVRIERGEGSKVRVELRP